MTSKELKSNILDFVVNSRRFIESNIKSRNELVCCMNFKIKKYKFVILVVKEKEWTISTDCYFNTIPKSNANGKGNFDDAYKKFVNELQEVVNVIDNR